MRTTVTDATRTPPIQASDRAKSGAATAFTARTWPAPRADRQQRRRRDGRGLERSSHAAARLRGQYLLRRGHDPSHALRGALANASGLLPAQRADVINLSLGSESACPQQYQTAIDQVRAAGVVVVAAAGNDSRQGLKPAGSPANCNGVIGVAALGINSQRAPYSNAGLGTDVGAPGGDDVNQIFSTFGERVGATYSATTQFIQGTSMAAPHVTGVISLMKSVNPALTPANIDTLLSSGALTDDIGPAGPDELGVGRLNALKAVTAASAAPGNRPGQLSVVPTSLNFADAASTQQVTVANAGTAAVSVTQVVASAPWLSATAEQVNATTGLGSYRIAVSRTGLATGVYTGNVEFRGSVGTAARTTVLMQVTAAPIVSDAGQHYVLLINPATGNTAYQAIVSARGREVLDWFPTSVLPATYELIAGTDLDNDGYICDEGEACGEFPLMGQVAPVQVNPTATGLSFPTAYIDSVRPLSDDESSISIPGTRAPARGYRRLE